MNVTIVNRVYPPASGATGVLLAELAEDLVQRGWGVTVVTGAAEGAPASEIVRGVRVERVEALAFGKEQLARRALSYAGMYPAYYRRLRALPVPDVLVTKTDPPLHLVLGPLLRHRGRTRLVHWAQDLYPEVAEELGVFKPGGVMAGAIRAASTWALKRYDAIVSIGRCMTDRLKHRGVESERITVIPNWSVDALRSLPHEANPFRDRHVQDSAFVVMYSGNMGRAHPFEAMVDAAAELEATDPDIRFVMIGEGPRRPWLEAQVAARTLSNVMLLPFQPKERLSESLSAADLHLVSMHESVCGLVVPSKIYGVLAAGRPALFLGPRTSEAARLLEEEGCGQVLPSPSGAELAEAIRQWKREPARTRQAGLAAEAYSEGARERAFDAFEAVFAGNTPPDRQAPLVHTAPPDVRPVSVSESLSS